MNVTQAPVYPLPQPSHGDARSSVGPALDVAAILTPPWLPSPQRRRGTSFAYDRHCSASSTGRTNPGNRPLDKRSPIGNQGSAVGRSRKRRAAPLRRATRERKTYAAGARGVCPQWSFSVGCWAGPSSCWVWCHAGQLREGCGAWRPALPWCSGRVMLARRHDDRWGVPAWGCGRFVL